MSNFTKWHLVHKIFRILHLFSQFLWNLAFNFLVLPVQDYRLIGDMRFLNLFFLLTRYVTCSFIPPKIKLWRTSCCQILAIYSIVKGDHPPRSRSLALTPTCLLVLARQGRAGETLGTRLDGHVVIIMSTYVRVSLRSKHLRLVSEQRKSEERDFRFWPSEKWNESQKMKEGRGFLPSFLTPSPLTRAIFRVVFDFRSSFFAPKQHGNAYHAG